jgi:hypothetical protein
MNEASKARPSGGYRSIRRKTSTEEPVDIGSDLVAFVLERLERRVEGFTDQLRQLQDIMAERASGKSLLDARRRLQNPELNTTYVAERQRALTARRIELRRVLAEWLPRLIAAAVELEFVETELAAADARIEELDKVLRGRKETGLYPAAATAVDRLHEDYGVTHWQWARADHDELRRIAQILRGKS